jgi:hypothetical protein
MQRIQLHIETKNCFSPEMDFSNRGAHADD